MITKVEDFFTKGCGRCDRFDTPNCSAKHWADGLKRLRAICLSAGLEETVKWGQACYTHGGKNIAIMGAHKDKFVLGFFNAAVLQDPHGVLEKAGPNTQHANTLNFTASDPVTRLEQIILALLEEAKVCAQAGIRPPKTTATLDLPEELIDALDADPMLAEAFHALTLGRKRSYVINLSSAKTSETRLKRIEKFRDKIIAGKGAMER